MLIYNFFLIFLIVFSLSKMIFDWNLEYDDKNDQFILHYTIRKKRKTVVILQSK
jgi:hypothetical protein